jgi:hypothetical protein
MRNHLLTPSVVGILALSVGYLGAAQLQWPSPFWPPMSAQRLAGEECPVLEGEYLLAGRLQRVMVIDGVASNQESPVTAYIRQWHPRGESLDVKVLASPESIEVPRLKSATFRIQQSGPTSFTVQSDIGKDGQIELLRFDSTVGDFKCIEGVVVLREHLLDSGGEGTSRKGNTLVQVARGSDGSLLYHQHRQTRVSTLLIFSNEQSIDNYFIFRRAPGDPGVPAGSEDVEFTITPDDPRLPQHIQFDVVGTRYIAQQDSSIPMNIRIRLGMRRFAEERLSALGYCPHGFVGPEVVLTRRMSNRHHFSVDCVRMPKPQS